MSHFILKYFGLDKIKSLWKHLIPPPRASREWAVQVANMLTKNPFYNKTHWWEDLSFLPVPLNIHVLFCHWNHSMSQHCGKYSDYLNSAVLVKILIKYTNSPKEK